MGIIFSFEEIAQYGLTFRIYDPVFPDTGALIFRNFFYVIAAAAGRTLHVPLLLCIYSLSAKSSSLISSWCTERGTSGKIRCPSIVQHGHHSVLSELQNSLTGRHGIDYDSEKEKVRGLGKL